MTSRTLSSSGLAEALSEQTGEVWFAVIILSHADFASTLRFAARTEDFTHDGNTYVAAPFDVVLPTDAERELPQGTIDVDGTDTTVLAAIRAVSTPVTFECRIIRESDPNDVEVGPWVGEIRGFRYGTTIQAPWEPEPILSETYPADAYDPANFPGMFSLATGTSKGTST